MNQVSQILRIVLDSARQRRMNNADQRTQRLLAEGKIDLTPTGNMPELSEIDLNLWLNPTVAAKRAFRRSAQERFKARRRHR